MLTIRRAKQKDCPSIARVRAFSTGLYTPDEIETWAYPRTPESCQQSIRGKESMQRGFAGVYRDDEDLEVFLC